MKVSTQYILVGIVVLIFFIKASFGVPISSPIELLVKILPYAMVGYMSVSIYHKTNILFGLIIFILGIVPLVYISIDGVKSYNEAISKNNLSPFNGILNMIQSGAVLIILFFIYVLMDFPEMFQRKQK